MLVRHNHRMRLIRGSTSCRISPVRLRPLIQLFSVWWPDVRDGLLHFAVLLAIMIVLTLVQEGI